MDVTCDRCSTRYEFDEALVSSRGTTVKCTNCGHQFKVYRPEGAVVLDGWQVRTTDGRELNYQAMRHLQAAIAGGTVSRQDVLIPNDGGDPRRLGRIEELRSFFAAADEGGVSGKRRDVPVSKTAPGHRTESYRPGPSGAGLMTTNVGSGAGPAPKPSRPVLAARSGDTLRPPHSAVPDPVTIPRAGGVPLAPESVSEAPTVVGKRRRGPARKGAPAPTAKPSRYGSDEAVDRLHDAVHNVLDSAPGAAAGRPSEPIDVSFDAGGGATPTPPPRHDLPKVADDDTIGDPLDSADRRPELESEFPLEDPSGAGRAEGMSLPPATPSPSAARPSILRRSDVYSDPRFSHYGRGRPGLARWVVGIVAVGVLAVGGFALFKRYVPQADKPAASKEDGRVDELLEGGDKRLAEGDVEGAKDQFIKASGITESDPRVSRALARIEVIRADMLWLHAHVLDHASPLLPAVKQNLDKAVGRAAEASEKASGQSPDDPLTVAVQIDVLRLQNKAADARQLVAKLEGAGPEGLRALALLDLSERDPNYGSVIDRLRTAARSERKLLRSQAILVYTLARAGKRQDAEKELEALKSQGTATAWLPALEAFVGASPELATSASASAAASSAPPAPLASSPPTTDHAEPFATAEPDHVEPFATAEPDTPPPDSTEPTATTPPAPTDTPPSPVDTSDLPPTIDTSDLPP